jgi:hypothetical protein
MTWNTGTRSILYNQEQRADIAKGLPKKGKEIVRLECHIVLYKATRNH